MKTMREKELEDALAVAVEALEEFYGGDADDSETVQHLREMLKKS